MDSGSSGVIAVKRLLAGLRKGAVSVREFYCCSSRNNALGH